MRVHVLATHRGEGSVLMCYEVERLSLPAFEQVCEVWVTGLHFTT